MAWPIIFSILVNGFCFQHFFPYFQSFLSLFHIYHKYLPSAFSIFTTDGPSTSGLKVQSLELKFIYSEKATKIWRNFKPNDHYILIIGRILWLWQSLSTTRRKLKIACYYHWHFDSRFSTDNALVGPWTAIGNHHWKASTYQGLRKVKQFGGASLYCF